MEKTNLSISDYLLIVVSIILAAVTIYTLEIKTMISDLLSHWRPIGFCVAMMTLLWRFTHIFIRNSFNAKINDKFKSLEETNKQLVDYNKQMLDVNAEYLKTSAITQRVMKDLVLPIFVTHSKESKEDIVKFLYGLGFTVPQYRSYGIGEDIIIELEKKYYEIKLDEIKKTKTTL